MAVDNTNFKGSWRPEEDEALRKSVALHGEKNWSIVARHFNTLMGRHPNLGRAPKQCRSRYLQQLVPGIKTGEWTIEEENILVDGHRQFGNQWTLISSMLPGRTETSVKNHYNCTARRKVPSDLSKMTILQRYLASIGVISISGSGKGSAAKLASLGSSYPSSGGSQFFSTHSAAGRHRSTGGGSNTRAASAAAAAAARSAPLSPAGSDQYDDDEEAMRQQYQASYAGGYEYDDGEAAAYEAAALMQAQALHLQLQGSYGDNYGEEDDAMEAEADGAQGAAAGLLQLARAALLHLEEEEEETDEGGPGPSGPHCDTEEVLRQQKQAAHQQQRKPSGGGWLKAEVVHSGSEDSDHTAEEEEDGSPLSEAQLKRHMKPGSSGGKRSSPGSRPSQREAASNTSSKRCRSMWGAEQHLPGTEAATGTSGGGGAFGLQLPLVGSSSIKARPVLDVSELNGTGCLAPGPSAPTAGSVAPPEPHSPAATGRSDTCGPPAPADPGAQALLAFMMSAFMGAAHQGPDPGSAASTLSPSQLAAIARAMAMSALSGQALGRGSSRGSQAGGDAAAGAAAACHAPHSPTGSPAAPGGGGLPSPGSAVSSDMSQVLSALTREGSGVQQPASAAASVQPLWPSLLEQQLKAAAAASGGH